MRCEMEMELKRTSIWKNLSQEEKDEIFEYSEEYKEFLDLAKTEREAVTYIIERAKKAGFIDLKKAIKGKIKVGDKIFVNNKNKSCVLFVVGEDLQNGMKIVASHIDSPRLDSKANPLYEDSELAMFKTHYYGGIKKYQWPTIPLSIHGVAYDKKGKAKQISIGEDETDPVFFINDLLPHLSADQNKKTLDSAISGESLNVVVGHMPSDNSEAENPIKRKVLELIYEKYGLVEEDFLISELEIVPAFKAKDVGLDRSLIAGYGQDDRVCSYANFRAILETQNPKKTAVAIFADKEEIGSVGNSSMSSKFFENSVAEILFNMGDYSDIKLRRALSHSKVLSADVTAALDPNFKEVMDEKNAARLGYGVCLSKYTGSRGKSSSNDANAEFLVEIREIFEKEEIIWQTGELGKVDQGGGGTVAFILAESGAEVVDMGTAMLSMHAPYELLSKADCHMTYKAYKAFLK